MQSKIIRKKCKRRNTIITSFSNHLHYLMTNIFKSAQKLQCRNPDLAPHISGTVEIKFDDRDLSRYCNSSRCLKRAILPSIPGYCLEALQ